jgi:hypothetical protein
MKMRAEIGEAYETSTSALQAAKGQRLSLRRAIGEFERALATPVTDPVEGCIARLTTATLHLQVVWALHVDVTEGSDGLYEEILDNAPRLANRINRFKREHATIGEAIERGVADLRGATALTPELRGQLVTLFDGLTRHRKRGLDLVYEAYHVDIGGES